MSGLIRGSHIAQGPVTSSSSPKPVCFLCEAGWRGVSVWEVHCENLDDAGQAMAHTAPNATCDFCSLTEILSSPSEMNTSQLLDDTPLDIFRFPV